MAGARDAPIRFRACLQRPARPANASWRFLRLPATASARLPSRAQVAVAGTFAGHAFRALLQPDGEGGHWLKLPRALLQAAGVDEGERVALVVTPGARLPEPRLPAALREALRASPAAAAQWKAITPAARRDFIHWIGSAKRAETRAKRIRKGCDMLAAGRKRVCCFDASGRFSRGRIGVPEAAPAVAVRS